MCIVLYIRFARRLGVKHTLGISVLCVMSHCVLKIEIALICFIGQFLKKCRTNLESSERQMCGFYMHVCIMNNHKL